jgi:hypothetical protein
MEIVLYLMQKVTELIQTLAGHLAIERSIGANVSHLDICVHGINLEQAKDTPRTLEKRLLLSLL